MTTKDELAQAASLLAKRRNRKLGRKGLRDMALRSSRLKDELYPGWAAKIRRGERLVLMPPPESEK